MLTMITTILSILLCTFLCDALPLISPRNHAMNTVNIAPDGRVLFAPMPEGYAPMHDPCLAPLPHYVTYRYPRPPAPTIIQLARTETTVPAPVPVPIPMPAPVAVPMPLPAAPVVEVDHPHVKVALPAEHEVLPHIAMEAPCEAPIAPVPTPYHPAITVTEEKHPVLIPMHAHVPGMPEAPCPDAGTEYELKKHKVYDPISVVVLKNVGNKVLDSDTN